MQQAGARYHPEVTVRFRRIFSGGGKWNGKEEAAGPRAEEAAESTAEEARAAALVLVSKVVVGRAPDLAAQTRVSDETVALR